MAFKFEKLVVWQKAIEFGTHVHELTRKFPKDELYILTSQIKRAADSVALNIAEGSTGQTNAQFRHFLLYAARSGIEAVSCLHIARNRKLIDDKDFDKFYVEAEEIIRMIHGLRNSIK